ncbi:MAG: hypothetical protein GY798_01405 [Hyphomicrobiales bacterium]|nr:hypothetical protein [Hyphomicrobiales bacterium]
MRIDCTFYLDARIYQTEAFRAFVGCLSDFIEAAARNPDDSLASVIHRNDVAARLRRPGAGSPAPRT